MEITLIEKRQSLISGVMKGSIHIFGTVLLMGAFLFSSQNFVSTALQLSAATHSAIEKGGSCSLQKCCCGESISGESCACGANHGSSAQSGSVILFQACPTSPAQFIMTIGALKFASPDASTMLTCIREESELTHFFIYTATSVPPTGIEHPPKA